MVYKTTINKIGDNAVFSLEPEFKSLWMRGEYKPRSHTYVCHRVYGTYIAKAKSWISQCTPVYVARQPLY